MTELLEPLQVLIKAHVLAAVLPEPLDTVTDSTAAGDSFNAAYLVRLLAGDDMAARLEAGAALSRRVIQERGALSEKAASVTGT